MLCQQTIVFYNGESMDKIQAISWVGLVIASVPALFVLGIIVRWHLDLKHTSYALLRMLLQLLMIGYFLTYLFTTDNQWVVVAVLAAMVFISSWIALDVVKTERKRLYFMVSLSVFLGGGVVLWVVTQGVLRLDPWYLPQYMVPLAGMIFSTSMNSVSLAAERYFAEQARGVSYKESRKIAFQASMLPTINSLFAVGLVALPGMMTGQILSGVSPLIAARYQIVVMLMLFAATGLSAALFLRWVKDK